MGPEPLLQFWFADAASAAHKATERYAFWFQAIPETDAAIRTRFSDLVMHAQACGLASWESQPRGWLALIIALDQLPRNLYRGTAAAFATDPLAQQVARRGFERSFHSSLSIVEHLFCMMPFQHAEDGALQEEAVRRGEVLRATAPPEWTAFIEEFQGSARKHLAIIQRFGRFPHRNVLLGRTSTPEEQAFLDSGSGSFGQAPQKEENVSKRR